MGQEVSCEKQPGTLRKSIKMATLSSSSSQPDSDQDTSNERSHEPLTRATQMATSSPILAVPDEVLTMIFREVRAFEQLSSTRDKGCEHTEGDDCDYSNSLFCDVASLCTVSKGFRGPATSVLYEHVELTTRNTRRFLHSLAANEHLAKLVKSIRTNHYPGYQPKMCYEISPRKVDDNIEAVAERAGVAEILAYDTNGRLRTKGDVDQLLVAVVCKNMKQLDVTLAHPELSWRRPDTTKLKPRRLFAGIVLKTKSRADFGANLTTLKLRAPLVKTLLLNMLAPVFELKSLRSLTLQRVSSKCGISPSPTPTFKKTVRQKKGSSGVRDLHLLECSLTKSDLEVLLRQCPQLEHLHWRVNEKCPYVINDTYCDAVIEAKVLVEVIFSSKLGLKSLTIDHLEEMTDWSGVARRNRYGPNSLFVTNYAASFPDPRQTQKILFGPADPSGLSSLQSLEITCPALTGLPDTVDEKLNIEARIPVKARELHLRMPANPFPSTSYNLVQGTRHRKMLMTLCKELNELSLDLPLSYVKVSIPAGWPKLAQRACKLLRCEVAAVERVHLELEGVGDWKHDSHEAPPLPRARPKKRKRAAAAPLSVQQELKQELRDL